jgi:cytochrome P450
LTSVVRADFPTRADLKDSRLKQHDYLNAVLKEGLRLYPPAPDYLFRSTSHEGAIVAGQVVPPHTTVTINMLAAYRDPTNFYKPNEFIPDRWLKAPPIEFQNDDRAVFKPFSVGPRDCIGKKSVKLHVLIALNL